MALRVVVWVTFAFAETIITIAQGVRCISHGDNLVFFSLFSREYKIGNSPYLSRGSKGP